MYVYIYIYIHIHIYLSLLLSAYGIREVGGMPRPAGAKSFEIHASKATGNSTRANLCELFRLSEVESELLASNANFMELRTNERTMCSRERQGRPGQGLLKLCVCSYEQ